MRKKAEKEAVKAQVKADKARQGQYEVGKGR